MKKRLLLLAPFLLVIIAGIWVYNHSFIEIIVDGPVTGNVRLSITDQRNNKPLIIDSSSAVTKKLVGRSVFEVLATQQEKSHLVISETQGFLRKTTIRVKLQPEKQRIFVGDNPSPCMNLVDGVLLSYNCGAGYSQVQIHVPATEKQASFIRKKPQAIEASVESTVSLASGYYALIREVEQGIGSNTSYKLYPLRHDLVLSNGIPLPDLVASGTYAIKPYRDGFLVYSSTSYDSLLYYSSIHSKPEVIRVSQPKDSKLKPYALATNGSSVAIAYSNNTEGETQDVHAENSGKRIVNQIQVLENNTLRSVTIKGQFSALEFCGLKKICLMGNRVVEIYSLENDKAMYQYRVSNIESMLRSGDALVLARHNEVIEFDVETRTGFTQYSYGDYTFCGVKPELNGYVLCLINKRQKKIALYIDQNNENVDSIDKKISKLLFAAGVKDVSVSGKYIRITPELGHITYIESLQSFGYDPQIKKQVGDQISNIITELGIDRGSYQVITTIKL